MKATWVILVLVVLSSCSKDTCNNGICDGNESMVDCGGDCPPCDTENQGQGNWSGGGSYFFTGTVYDGSTGLPVDSAYVHTNPQNGVPDSTNLLGNYLVGYDWMGSDGFIFDWPPNELIIQASKNTAFGDTLIDISNLSNGDTVYVDFFIN